MSLVQLDRELPRMDMYAPAFRRRVLETRRQLAADAAKAAGLELIAIRKAARAAARAAARQANRDAKRMLVEARRAIQSLIAEEEIPIPRPLAMDIIRDVADQHQLSIGIILGASRNRAVVAVRHQAMAMVHIARPDLSLPAIGRLFKRDHTSILFALRKSGAYLSRTA